MSRARTRARNRRAQLERLCAEFAAKRKDAEAFKELLVRIAKSEHRLWALAKLVPAGDQLTDEEMAMIAQVIAPQLAAMTPGSVRRRQERAK